MVASPSVWGQEVDTEATWSILIWSPASSRAKWDPPATPVARGFAGDKSLLDVLASLCHHSAPDYLNRHPALPWHWSSSGEHEHTFSQLWRDVHTLWKHTLKVKPTCTCFAELDWNKSAAEKLHSKIWYRYLYLDTTAFSHKYPTDRAEITVQCQQTTCGFSSNLFITA